ncbi:hypothetical protein NQ318_012774 [Aromia moschata]|uniref:Uncharacterized protein n=1 Tax=Aromia moschata TaxID=1265417 RepID=A0AAV8YGX0_9CUCU|nr:hypothetical protein NQ318_012774 [Aromia moschata]
MHIPTWGCGDFTNLGLSIGLKCWMGRMIFFTGLGLFMICLWSEKPKGVRPEFNPNFKRKLHADAIPSRNLHKAETSTPSCSWANNEVLNPTEVKEAVEENKTLKRKYDSLTRRKLELEHKIARSSKRITSKTRALASCHEELRKKSSKDQNLKTKINFVSKVFSDAQIKLLLGKKVFWSEDDLAKAFSLRHMGGKQCYLYLKNAMNMPLPALACVQKWAASGFTMPSCSVYGCENISNTTNSVDYHPFPTKAYRQQWLNACVFAVKVLHVSNVIVRQYGIVTLVWKEYVPVYSLNVLHQNVTDEHRTHLRAAPSGVFISESRRHGKVHSRSEHEPLAVPPVDIVRRDRFNVVARRIMEQAQNFIRASLFIFIRFQ